MMDLATRQAQASAAATTKSELDGFVSSELRRAVRFVAIRETRGGHVLLVTIDVGKSTKAQKVCEQCLSAARADVEARKRAGVYSVTAIGKDEPLSRHPFRLEPEAARGMLAGVFDDDDEDGGKFPHKFAWKIARSVMQEGRAKAKIDIDKTTSLLGHYERALEKSDTRIRELEKFASSKLIKMMVVIEQMLNHSVERERTRRELEREDEASATAIAELVNLGHVVAGRITGTSDVGQLVSKLVERGVFDQVAGALGDDERKLLQSIVARAQKADDAMEALTKKFSGTATEDKPKAEAADAEKGKAG